MASPEAWEAASVGSKVLYCNSPLVLGSQQLAMLNHWKSRGDPCGYESIPINTIFRGMNIHLPAIFMFTRGTRF